MSDDLVALFKSREEARLECDRLGAMNTAGLSDDQRVMLDLAYRKAQHAYLTAANAYDVALERKLR